MFQAVFLLSGCFARVFLLWGHLANLLATVERLPLASKSQLQSSFRMDTVLYTHFTLKPIEAQRFYSYLGNA